MRVSGLLLFTILCFGVHSTGAGARTWVVKADGSGDVPNLVAAADSAMAGDSVAVEPGTYQESSLRFGPGVSVVGVAGAASTVLDGGTDYRLLRGEDLALEGLTFIGLQETGYGYQYAVRTTGVSEIRDCVFDVEVAGIIAEDELSVFGTTFTTKGFASVHLEQQEEADGSLVVEGCRFDGISGGAAVVARQTGVGSFRIEATVRGCEFVDCVASAMVTYDPIRVIDLTLLVEDNLFARNEVFGTAIGPILFGVTGTPRFDGVVDLQIVGNTIARTVGRAIGWTSVPLPDGTRIERNAITGNGGGVLLPVTGTGFVVECNNVWGNADGNWEGLPDPTGTAGNFSESPRYCDAAGGNFTLAANSPMLPVGNSCAVQIGAFGQGCGPISVEESSWGEIKALYRSE